jgi:predicted DNA-binding transcriptional regulator YafY
MINIIIFLVILVILITLLTNLLPSQKNETTITFSKNQHDKPKQLRSTCISTAINEQRPLRIKYNAKERVILPYYTKDVYLYAFCLVRNQPRTFNIEKIIEWDLLDDKFEKDPAIAEYLWEQRVNYKKKSFAEHQVEQKLQPKITPIKAFTSDDAQRIIDQKIVISIKYISAKNETTERKINSYSYEGLYLHAWCHKAKRTRNFRFERILDWQETDEKYLIKKR